ncbi:MAG: hypothetical protein UH853_03275 [Muribaculaceae bacterium]|jgi:hypothetical protein|nr:hypothetical protein [Muribaculaceae bacterium]
MDFDESKAIEYIKSHLPEGAPDYDEDEILNVIDIIFDYYEDNGMLDIDFDDEEDETEGLIAHVAKMLSKDPYSTILPEHVSAIVTAEIEYENSLL